jgi:hypothetical protein
MVAILSATNQSVKLTLKDNKMPQNSDEAQEVWRINSSNGNIDYGDSVTLKESTRSQINVIPFFINRTDRTHFACKITQYSKLSIPPFLREERSISLDENASIKLLNFLRVHLAVSQENNEGHYLVIPITDQGVEVSNADPIQLASSLLTALNNPQVLSHFQDLDLTNELTSALKNVIKIREMRSAVMELRESLNQGQHLESIYQNWCERHSWAFGNAYVMRDEVRSISTGDNLDLLLPNVIGGYRDIVELKRPNMEVLRWDDDHRNFYFSPDTSKAIGQCHRYLDVLHEVGANGLRDNPSIVSYHPRATIVIGRSHNWEINKQKALHGLNNRLNGIKVMTYDHLLDQGERLLQIINPVEEENITIPSSQPDWDDLPF